MAITFGSTPTLRAGQPKRYKWKNMIFRPTLCIFGCIFLASCGGSSQSATQTTPIQETATQTVPTSEPERTLEQIRTEMDLAWASIVAEVGTPHASDVSQCGAMAVGAKACGGAARYIVYSRQVSNEGRLESLAESYTSLQREWNTTSQIASDCSMVIAPDVELVAGKCQSN